MTKAEKIETLITYLKVKLEERDWHAISDCANDIRVLEAQSDKRQMTFVGGEFDAFKKGTSK